MPIISFIQLPYIFGIISEIKHVVALHKVGAFKFAEK